MLSQKYTTLNMLRTSQNTNELTAFEDLNSPFNWNSTPMVPLDNTGMVYFTPNVCTVFAPY